MKNLLLLSLVILALTSFFYEPLKFYVTQNGLGFKIEELTYLPSGYNEINKETYFNPKSDVPYQKYIEVTTRNDKTYIRFIQAGSTDTMNQYLDAIETDRYYTKESVSINKNQATIYYYRNSVRHIVWTENNKRYDISTNDPYVGLEELEKIQDGIKIIKIDFIEPFTAIQDKIESIITPKTH